MKKKVFLPTLKKVDLPENVTSEVKLLAEKKNFRTWNRNRF